MSSDKIYLKDYKEVDYKCESVSLEIDITKDTCVVVNKSNYTKNPNTTSKELVLNGVDLELLSVKVNDEELNSNQFELANEKLVIKNLPDSFTLITKTQNKPYENFSGEGLYQSGNILCTQCEAEGFRKITFHQDRPDVMSAYDTKIIASKKRYPQLLSNGNLVDKGDIDEENHFVHWRDPHLKPSYLFAMVAGDLALVKDKFTTSENRVVDLEIYVDHGNEDKCAHAMESLKNSMKWDEQTYGLAYDLDIYMIVAVDSFNMGAMENKGLNIFNSHYVLAKTQTATDSDFQGIEGVIGHEYFHNWSGNRVTCRDWFQLTLKEGLTVYRDQEFSSDMGSRSVKRIEDIKTLKSSQFAEDAGPLSHPIQPKSYLEINNFYTATIYEKGAEIIRMYHTLLGDTNFKKGLKLYFERFDGQAVTCQDFLQAMSDASGVNLEHFSVWYDQNGTPSLNISTEYNQDTSEYKITITQNVTTNNEKYDCLYIPFHMELLDQTGKSIDIGDKTHTTLSSKQTTLCLNNIEGEVIPVFNTNFSAPVNIQYEYSLDQLLSIMAYAKDDYSKYAAIENVYELILKKIISQLSNNEEMAIEDKFFSGLESILSNDKLDLSFKSYLLDPPNINYLLTKWESVDLETTHKALEFLITQIASKFESHFLNFMNSFDSSAKYELNVEQIGNRSFLNTSMWYLAHLGKKDINEKIYSIFESANNMTLEIGSLKALMVMNTPIAQKACKEFYVKWKKETLVIQKWFRLNSIASFIDTSYIRNLETLPEYDKKVPNLVRSLIGAFSTNVLALNKADGSGYKYLCEKILEIDSYNPQIAARLAKSFSYINKLDAKRKELLISELKKLKDAPKLSNDTLEVISANLD